MPNPHLDSVINYKKPNTEQLLLPRCASHPMHFTHQTKRIPFPFLADSLHHHFGPPPPPTSALAPTWRVSLSLLPSLPLDFFSLGCPSSKVSLPLFSSFALFLFYQYQYNYKSAVVYNFGLFLTFIYYSNFSVYWCLVLWPPQLLWDPQLSVLVCGGNVMFLFISLFYILGSLVFLMQINLQQTL